MSFEQIISRCLEIGVNCLAVSDHGTIAGALKLKEIAPFIVIVAEEILTPAGELMGLFLSKEVPNNLSPEETITRIREQGGLVSIPHPYDRLRPSALTGEILESIAQHVDIIEVFNARSLSPGSSAKALELANRYGKATSAGSDAHTPLEIGHACVKMPEFSCKDEFVASLFQGQINGSKSSPFVHVASTLAKLKKHPQRSGEGL